MKSNVYRFAVVLAVVAFALAAMGSLQAEEGTGEFVLKGALTDTETGEFLLIESESGEEVLLRGMDELAEFVGSEVRVTGQWAIDDDGIKYFQVESIERLS